MDSSLVDEACLRFLRGQASIAMFVFDGDGQVVAANAYAGHLIKREPIGLKTQDVFVDFLGSLSLRQLARDPSRTHMLNVNTSPGLPQTLHFIATEVEGHILLLGQHDSAEQTGSQNQILLLNQELNNLTRTLQKSNAELATLNQMKNQMLGMAAHDLRSPLGVIMNYSEILGEEAQLSDEQRGFIDAIRNTSKFMLTVVDDVLDIAAIEAGQLKINLQPTDLVQLKIGRAHV